MTIASHARRRTGRPKAWSRESVTVLMVCILGWAFDVYEQTVMQIVTPILIKEWDITPATIGNVTTIGRWVGMIGLFVFPALADLYGRKPLLIDLDSGLFAVFRAHRLRQPAG